MKIAIKLFALAFVMLIGTASFAQKPKAKQQHQHMNKDSAFAKVSKRLNLTAEQQAKLKDIIKQNHAEMKALREAIKDSSKEEKRKALVAQRQKNDERVKQILNEQQKDEYNKIKAERKLEIKKHREARKAEQKKNKDKKKSSTPAEIKLENNEGEADEDVLEEGIL
jgi:Spy/CpxP family protein refolding chaperone